MRESSNSRRAYSKVAEIFQAYCPWNSFQMIRAAEFFEVALPEQGRDYGLMDWQQLRDLVRQGFEVGGTRPATVI